MISLDIGAGAVWPHGLDKGFISKYLVGYSGIPDEYWRSKHCDNNNKDEDNSPYVYASVLGESSKSVNGCY